MTRRDIWRGLRVGALIGLVAGTAIVLGRLAGQS